jgi:phage terminase large subunit
VYYTRRSKNIKKEVDNYQWMMVGGKTINKPIDDFNHGLDAIRYAVYTKYSKKKLLIF